MKRFVSILLVALLLVAVSASSFADGSRTIEKVPASTWKTIVDYTTRYDTGSFWQARKLTSPNACSVEAYLFMKGGDRCTKYFTFSDGTTQKGLNYLAGQAIAGKQYRLNGRGAYYGTYGFWFNP